ncbi:unnamed protein product [Ascophyllum nodosum]
MRQATCNLVWRSRTKYLQGCRRDSIMLPRSVNGRSQAEPAAAATAHPSRCSRDLSSGGASSRFPPLAEAASVSFPGRELRVSRVGFGSPWVGAASDRSLDLSRALSDGGCNLVQLTSEVKSVKKHDKNGNPLPVPEWPARSWETRTFENVGIPRDDLCLLWELSASGKPVKEALNPSRAVEHLDRLLTYHGLSYIDVFMLEIPCFQGGESAINDYRRHTGEAVRLAMTEFAQLAGDRVKTLGFSWKGNPHNPHPGRAPDSPLSDVMELRDLLAPSKPFVAMFPVGLACGATVGGLEASSGSLLGLPENSGVFQIGTHVSHAQRPDGRPFRMVDVNPRPISDIMPDLKSRLAMTIHLELEYTKRFGQGDAQRKSETSQGGGGETGTDEDASGGTSSSMSPLPPKEDISWGHILAHNQHRFQGLDEWEAIRDSQIKPTVNRALDTLRIRGEAEGEWGFLYRSTLGSLMSEISAVMEVRKAHQLAESSNLMNELAPSLKASTKGVASEGAMGDKYIDRSRSGESVVGQCTAAALATGVNCVLDEEFSSSREAGRVTGFSQVSHEEIKRLYVNFRLPE